MYAIGETVYDIIFKVDKPVAAKAGGSMLNTVVSLGRAGRKPRLITALGQDRVGDLILTFLKENGVREDMITQNNDVKTTISLAFIDENGDADYSFYKAVLPDALIEKTPDFKHSDIFLFGSFFSLEDQNRDYIVKLLREVERKNCLCIYDPNIRKPHRDKMSLVRHRISENIESADIIRASDEDFKTAFSANTFDEAAKLINPAKRILIYTINKKGLWLMGYGHKIFLNVPEIKVLSSIGAGDAFNAGLIFAFEKRCIHKEDLPHLHEDSWKAILHTAIAFAQDVCRSYDNYISFNFASELDA